MTSDPIIEIRTYQLKPGTRADYHRIFVEESVPLLTEYGIRVVRYGPCLVDENAYVLIRAFDSLEQREKLEDRFYGSDDWRQKLREAVVSRIEAYQTVVLPVTEQAVAGLAEVR